MRKCSYKDKCRAQSGMSLLEVIFAIMILLVLAMTSASLIRNGVDLQVSLAQQSKVAHRLSVAMKKLFGLANEFKEGDHSIGIASLE